MNEIITVSNLTKEYRLGSLSTLKDDITNLYRSMSNQPKIQRKSFKALDDINFSLSQGEIVGIIGHNGAGKSTLLKILSRIVTPSAGNVYVGGKIAPLIEVGAGLIGDLTGRENIYLNAAILGMKKAEVDKKFDEIVAFSELEEFIDTPIKRYSSGMQVRIGFAIATSVEAEILIVDEVLAVGDLAFQRKCFDRVEEIIKRRGNTVLIVSHNIRQVVRLCSRVLLLDHGRIIDDGKASEVAEKFYAQSNQKIQENQASDAKGSRKIRSSGEIEILRIELLDSGGNPVENIFCGDLLTIQIRLEVNVHLEKPEIVIGTHTTDFVYLTGNSTALFEERPDLEAGEQVIELTLESFPLVAGTYCVRLAIFDKNGRPILNGETLRMFHVMALSNESKQPGLRNLHLPGTWKLNSLHFAEPTIKAQLAIQHSKPINDTGSDNGQAGST